MTLETKIPVFFIGLPALFFGVLFLLIAAMLKAHDGDKDVPLRRRFAVIGGTLLVLGFASPLLEPLTTPLVNKIVGDAK